MAEKSCEKGPGGLKHLCLRVRYLVLVGACDGATELGVSTDGSPVHSKPWPSHRT